MGHSGAVPSEDSTGKRTRRSGITKTGNAHLRRIAVEVAWSYRRPPWYGLRKRQESISEEVKEIAWKAQHRLHERAFAHVLHLVQIILPCSLLCDLREAQLRDPDDGGDRL